MTWIAWFVCVLMMCTAPRIQNSCYRLYDVNPFMNSLNDSLRHFYSGSESTALTDSSICSASEVSLITYLLNYTAVTGGCCMTQASVGGRERTSASASVTMLPVSATQTRRRQWCWWWWWWWWWWVPPGVAVIRFLLSVPVVYITTGASETAALVWHHHFTLIRHRLNFVSQLMHRTNKTSARLCSAGYTISTAVELIVQTRSLGV